MNLIITGHHFELTDSQKNFITGKAESRFQSFESRIHNIHVVITQEKLEVKSECTITSDFGEFFASTKESHMETAIEHTLSKIISEIKKKHDKITDHK